MGSFIRDMEKLFSKYLNVNLENESLKNQNLFLPPINIYPIYLVALLIEIENLYGIHFDDKDILDGKFSSFNNIAQLTLKLLPDAKGGEVYEKTTFF